MQKERYAPTIAHDLRALADLYGAVFMLMARRLIHRSAEPRHSQHGPFEIVRPRGMAEREERGS
jgi:hypothetical protein